MMKGVVGVKGVEEVMRGRAQLEIKIREIGGES